MDAKRSICEGDFYFNVSSTKSAEGATPKRVVRICLRRSATYSDIFLVSAVGATPNKYNKCRSFRPHTLNNVSSTNLFSCILLTIMWLKEL